MLQCSGSWRFNSTHFRKDVISVTAPTRSQKITCLELEQAPSKAVGTRTGIVSQRVTLRAWIWKNSSKPRTAPTIGTILLTIGYIPQVGFRVTCWGPNDPISVKVGEGPWRFPTKVLSQWMVRSPMSVVEHILGMSFWKGLSHKHKEHDV